MGVDYVMSPLQAQMDRLERKLDQLNNALSDVNLDSKAVAKMMRVHPETVRDWCRDGKIPFVPGSRPYKFVLAEIIEFRNNGGVAA